MNAERWRGLEVFPVDLGTPRLFSVDVEDWFHSNFETEIHIDEHTLPKRVESGVARVLDLLEHTGNRATFFVLGCVAEAHPGLARRIADAGHEIASHAWTHTLVYRQSREEFLADLKRARALLQDQSGQPVVGFRAPSWSIRWENLWALDVIAEAGFEYDSSIFPVETYLYGLRDAPCRPFGIRTRHGPLVEIPPSTSGIGRRRFIGVGGGFYLRALPLPFHLLAMRTARRRGEPFVVYCHPRELEPDAWRLKLPLSPKERFIFSFGLARGEARLRALLARGGWIRFDDALLERRRA